MEIFLLILIPVVLLFGIGVLFVSRARARGGVELEPPPAPPRRPPAPVEAPGQVITPERAAEIDEALAPVEAEPDVEVAEVLEPDVTEVPELEVTELEELVRPRFRDRLTRARAAMAGAFAGVRGRPTITDDTWDDLEEALLVADVGVGLTGELLDELRASVKAE